MFRMTVSSFTIFTHLFLAFLLSCPSILYPDHYMFSSLYFAYCYSHKVQLRTAQNLKKVKCGGTGSRIHRLIYTGMSCDCNGAVATVYDFVLICISPPLLLPSPLPPHAATTFMPLPPLRNGASQTLVGEACDACTFLPFSFSNFYFDTTFILLFCLF